MKPLLWTGIAIAAAAVLAVPIWLAVDDGGPRRAAALNPASAENAVLFSDVGKLTIAGINGGNPLPLSAFAYKVRRPVGATQPEVDVLEVVRRVDTASPSLLSLGLRGAKATTARLELLEHRPQGTPRPVFMTINLTNVLVDSYDDAHSGISNFVPVESIGLKYDTVSVVCAVPTCGSSPATTGDDRISITDLSPDDWCGGPGRRSRCRSSLDRLRRRRRRRH